MGPKQTLAVLGATGSIGVNTLDVVARHPERFEVFALSAQRRADLLEQQCLRWRPRYAVLGDAGAADDLQRRRSVLDQMAERLLSPGPPAEKQIAAPSSASVLLWADRNFCTR